MSDIEESPLIVTEMQTLAACLQNELIKLTDYLSFNILKERELEKIRNSLANFTAYLSGLNAGLEQFIVTETQIKLLRGIKEND